MAYDKGESAGNTLHKGWLKTREGEKYAPNTIIDNVYAMDGTPYDDVVKGYVKDVASGEEITSIQQDIANLKTADTTNLEAAKKYTENYIAAAHNNVNLDDSDVFYVVDGNGNIIFQADKDGAHSIDMYAGDVSLLSLNYKMSAISTIDDYEAFYITDKNGNVIARIDSTGVNSINFTSYSDETTEIANLNDVKAQVDRVEEEYKTADTTNLVTAKKYTEDYVASAHSQVNLDESDTFSIVDGNGNIAFMVDTDAVSKGVNFITYKKDADGNYAEVANLNNLKSTSDTHTGQITDIQQDNNTMGNRIQVLEEKTGYMNAIDETNSTTSFNNNVSIANELSVNKIRMEDDTFYFTDGASSANIIAKIDSDGITTTKVTADLVGNAASADKVNNKLTLTVGTNTIEYDGSEAKAATIGDTKITIEAGSGLTKGGNFTTNQTSDSTITLDVDPGEGIEIKDDKVTLKVATSSTLGGIKQGNDISTITEDGLVTINKIQNITANETSTTFSNDVKVNGELDVNTLKLQSDAYYFIDNENKAIATINKDGITTTAVTAENLNGNATSANKVNHTLTIGEQTYDGSQAITIKPIDLGLANALHFLGRTITDVSDGSTIELIAIGGETVTAKNGDVVLYDSREYVWDGSKWEELGDESNHKIKQDAVSSPEVKENEYESAFIDTITQNENGNITATKKNVIKANGTTPGFVYEGTGSDVTITNGIITVNDDSHNHIISNVDGLETRLSSLESKTGYMNPINEEDGISSFNNSVSIANELNVNKIRMEDDVFYFTDKSSPANIIAQIDEDGITSTQFKGKLAGNATSADKVNNKLIFNNGTANSVEYDGSTAQTINAASLGLSRTISANASDDDVIILTGTAGTNGVTYDAKHAKKGPTKINSTTGTDIKGSGASGTVTIPRITVDDYGHITALSNESFGVEMPTLPTVNNGKLSVTAGKGLTGDISFTANQSSDTNVTLDLNVATANEIGGIKSGNDITIDDSTGAVTISNIQHDLNVKGRLTVDQLALQDDIYYFTDSSGNVIAQIDADGLLTTRVRCENTKITNALDCVLMNVESSMSLNI